MHRFNIGKYTYASDDCVKIYDHMLHQMLDNIFREHCLSDSVRFKELICSLQLKSILKPTLDQEPFLSRHFSNEEMEKLSLLWIAVLGGYEMSAELLVRFGADVNELFGRHEPAVIDQNWTILHVLLQMKAYPENERLVRLVIDQGADLHAQDYIKGQSVLHIAVKEDRVHVVEMLLEKGADVHLVDNDERTPLLLAACYSFEANELLPMLMNYGADVFAKNRIGRNILHLLALNPREHADLVRVMIEKGVSLHNKENRNHYQPIHLATMLNHNESVKVYLEHGANVNALTFQGESPLYIAVSVNDNALVEILLRHGANIDLRTIAGRTALHAACKSAAQFSVVEDEEEDDPEDIIKLLLSAGADVLAEDNGGKTPLALISSRDDREDPEEESWPLIDVLALKKAVHPSIELKDERIIERYANLQDYYRKCTEEIDRMKSASFIETCTLFELLTKRQCQIAALMRNPEFRTNFWLYDYSEFLTYANDIQRAFERAERCYQSMLEQEDVINEAVYDILPDLVVKKVVHYILNCC